MPSRSRQNYKPARRSAGAEPPSGERLQKVLAAAGVGSRRVCEQFIVEGRVEIDRQVVSELGTRVDPAEHEIRVDGVTLVTKRRVYFLVNKPEGVVTTNRDPSGRPRVIDLIRSDERLFAVGRLDMSTEGLILVTNDGEIANKLAHPRYGVEKTYLARVAGEPAHDMLEKLKAGVHLAEGVARVADVKVKKRHHQSTELEIVLDEGKNREIRRLLAAVGHKVVRLKRIAIGPLRLGELPTGAYRPLTPDEVRHLQRFFQQAKPARGKSKRPGKRPPARRSGESAERPPLSGNEARRALARTETKKPMRKPDSPKQGAVLTFDEPPRPRPPRDKPTRGKPTRDKPSRAGEQRDSRGKKFKGKRRP